MPNRNTFSELYTKTAEDKSVTQENNATSESLANKNENTEIHNISNRFRAIDELTPVKECVKENGITDQDIAQIKAKSLYLETKEARHNDGKSNNQSGQLESVISSWPRQLRGDNFLLDSIAKQSAFDSMGFDLDKAKKADGIIDQCLNRGDIKPVLDDLREDMPLSIDAVTSKP